MGNTPKKTTLTMCLSRRSSTIFGCMPKPSWPCFHGSGLNRTRSAERCWAKLRSGRWQDALEETTGDLRSCGQLRSANALSFRPGVVLVPPYGDGAITVCGKKEEALRCIDSGYLHIAPYASDLVDSNLLVCIRITVTYTAQ